MNKPKNEDVALINKFDYSKCKYHNVEALESEYITAKMNGSLLNLMMKGYIFPIVTKGKRVLFKPWDMQTMNYFDKHMAKELIDPRFPLRTRPKLILKLKYPTHDNVGGWQTISPKELILWNIDNCKENKYQIKQAHMDGWQEQLETLTFLKRDE